MKARGRWWRIGRTLGGFLVAGMLMLSVAHAERLPNVVLILVDDLGFGELGCYGQRQIATPRLDRMAREGLRFTRFYAGSTVCAPSRSVLLTGLHTGHTRVRGNSAANRYAAQTLDPDDWSLGDVMRSAGYTTAVIGKWGLGDAGSVGTPDRLGFDHAFGFLNQTHAHNHFPNFLWRNGERVELPNDLVPLREVPGVGYSENRRVYANHLFFEEAENFIREQAGRPFFLLLAPTLPHANNERARALGDGMEVPDYGRYAGEDWPDYEKGHAAMNGIIDRGVGDVLDLLSELELDADTLVIFTSDNGPHREGGGDYDPEFFDSNGSLNGIKRDLTDGGIRVPMIARWPGRIAAGGVTDHVSYFGDVMPTLAELVGGELPREHDGISLLPTLLGVGEQSRHGFLYWEFYEGGISQAVLLDGRWKGLRRDAPTGAIALFDQAVDPGERVDCANAHPAIVARIAEIMRSEHTPNTHWRIDGLSR